MTATTKSIATAILDILSAATVDDRAVCLNSGQLDRPTYMAVNKILEALGGKWNRHERIHIFEEDPRDALEAVVMTGTVQYPADLGWFPTPEPLARRVVELADIRPDMTVLEPSAGTGNLANVVAEIVDKRLIDCCEIDQQRADILLTNGYDTHVGDFLDWDVVERFDRIIMNPPFARQQDIDHVLRAFDVLKPGGRLVAITSLGVAFRSNRKTVAFRELVEDYGFTEVNSGDAFAESGTKVRTMTLVLDKPEAA